MSTLKGQKTGNRKLEVVFCGGPGNVMVAASISVKSITNFQKACAQSVWKRKKAATYRFKKIRLVLCA